MEPPRPAAAGRLRRLLVRALHVGVLIAVTPAALLVLALAAVQLDAVAGWAARAGAVWASSDSLAVSVGGASGSWIRGIELTDLEITGRRAGEPAWRVGIDTLSTEYRLLPLLRRRVELSVVRAAGLSAWAARPDSSRDQAEATDDARTAWSLSVDRLAVDVRDVELERLPSDDEPWRLTDGRIRMRDLSAGEALRAVLDTLEASFRPPGRPYGWGHVAAAGSVDGDRIHVDSLRLASPESDVRARGALLLGWAATTAPPDLDLEVAAEPLHLADVGPFLPSWLPDSLYIQARATLRTYADTLRLEGSAEADGRGRLEFDTRISGTWSSPDVAGRVVVSAMDPGAWGLAGTDLVIDGEVSAELAELSAEGAHGTLTASVAVEGTGGTGAAVARLQASADAGAPWRGSWSAQGVGADGSGTLDLVLGGDPRWSLTGVLRYTAPAAGPPSPVRVVAGRFEARGRGFPSSREAALSLTLDSLAAGLPGDRLAVLGPGRLSAAVDSAGRATAELDLEAGGGRVALALEGDLDRRSVRLVRGTIRDVDVAALVGDTVPSVVGADLRGEVHLLDPVRASGELRVLTARYGPWALDSMRVRAETEGDDIRIGLRAAMADSGRVAAGARVRWREADRRIELDSLAWAGLDVRAIAAQDTSSVPPSSLAGIARGRASLGDQGWVGTFVMGVRPSVVGAATIDDGEARLDLHGTGADLVARLSSGETELSGRAHVQDLGDVYSFSLTDVAFRDVDLAALLPDAAPETRLTGALEANWTGPDVATGEGRLRLGLREARVRSALVDSVDLVAEVRGGTVSATTLLGAYRGTLTAEVQGEVTPEAPFHYVLSGRIDRPLAEDDQHAVHARFELEGRGSDPDSARAEAWLEVDSARWAGHAVEAVRLEASLADAEVALDTVDVRAPGMRIGGGGQMPLHAAEAGELRIDASFESPELLRALPFERTVNPGSGTFELVAYGSLDDLTLDVDTRADALQVGTTTIEGVALRGTARRTAAAGWIEGDALLEVDRVRTRNAPLERAEVAARLEAGDELVVSAFAEIDGRRDVSLRARANGLSRGIVPASITLERLDLRMDPDRWALVSSVDVSLRDGVRFDSLRLRSDQGRFLVHGGISADGPFDLEATLEGFEIGDVGDLVGFPEVRGRVDATLSLTGTADEPVVRATVDGRLQPAGAAPAALRVDLEYEAGAAELAASVALDGGGDVRAEASVPYLFGAGREGGLTDDASVRADVRASSFPLAWLGPFVAPSAVREPIGVLDGSLEVRGTPAAPELAGRLSLTGGAASLPALGIRYSGVNGHLTLAGSDVVVDSLLVRSGPGRLRASGRVVVGSLDDPSYDLRIDADRFEAVRSSAVRATVSGQVDARGRGLAPEISGTVVVERADLYLSELLSTQDIDAVTLTDEQWDELARVFAYQRPDEREQRAPLWGATALDLQVRLGRASWVRQRANPELALQFSGEMSVQKEAGDSLRLVGSIAAVPDRSWVEQFGRRFAIAQGNLTFRGPPSATRVEVQAQYEVPSRENPGDPEVVLILGVTGTPDDLTLELSSTPLLPASDMVSYLVTGRPADQSLDGGGDGSLTGTGGALALGRVSGAVEAYAREQIGLDVVEITTDGLDGLTLVAGRYLSPRLYVGVRQPVWLQRAAGDASQRAPDAEAELELQAVRWLLLNLRAGGRRGLEFYLRSQVAYE